MFRFPRTNFHELNLDWMLNRFKKMETLFKAWEDKIKGVVTSVNGATGDVIIPIPSPSTINPKPLGVNPAIGVDPGFSRGDHVHPLPEELTELETSVSEIENVIPKYKEITRENYALSSGGWNYETGATFSSNQAARIAAIYYINIHDGDYIQIDEPYTACVLVQTSGTNTPPYWTNANYVTGRIDLPQDCVGKRLLLSIRKNDGADISGELSTIPSYIHIYRRIYNGKMDRCRGYERFNVFTNHNFIDNSNTQNVVADSFNRYGRAAIIALPSTYKPTGDPIPVIMLCHGNSGYISATAWTGTSNTTLVDAFTNAGYAVFDVNQLKGSTGQSYDLGCPEQIELYLAAWEYIKTNYNVQNKMMLYALSFGNFAGLFFLRHYQSMFKAAILTGFRASIADIFTASTTDVKKEIAKNFNFSDQTGATYEADKTIGVDTYASIADPDNPYVPFQIPATKAVTSIADTGYYTVSNKTLTALRNGGNYIEWRILQNATHNDVCYFVDFQNEAILWFNRFKGSNYV